MSHEITRANETRNGTSRMRRTKSAAVPNPEPRYGERASTGEVDSTPQIAAEQSNVSKTRRNTGSPLAERRCAASFKSFSALARPENKKYNGDVVGPGVKDNTLLTPVQVTTVDKRTRSRVCQHLLDPFRLIAS